MGQGLTGCVGELSDPKMSRACLRGVAQAGNWWAEHTKLTAHLRLRQPRTPKPWLLVIQQSPILTTVIRNVTEEK